MAFLAALLIIALILINTGKFQSWLKDNAQEYLTETLGTRVEFESVGINVFGGDVRLAGLEVEDLQQRKMLVMDALEVHADLLPLLRKRVSISSVEVRGLNANLFKERPDTAANYQFILDAFKKDKHEEGKDEKKKKKTLELKLENLKLEDINVRFNDNQFKLGELRVSGVEYSGGAIEEIPYEKLTVFVKDLETSWTGNTKKGPVKNFVKVDDVKTIYPEIKIQGVHFKTDNGQPRKNAGKPKHGWFDAGHIDAVADFDLMLKHLGKDSVVIFLDRGVARDTTTGFDVRDLRAKAKIIGKQVHLRDIVVQQIGTTLKMDTAYIKLPNKAKGDTTLYYSTSTITGRTQLKDISRPFAPVLSLFTLPLNLRTTMNGDANGMRFNDVFVYTDDKLLTINAKGYIVNLKDKYKLNVHFDVNKMTARGGIKSKIINQFIVKKFMMKQLHNLGTIGYVGSFDVLWKREVFRGLLTSPQGNIDFSFTVDDLNKYVSGKARSNALEIGKIMDMSEIGEIGASANFQFDISKPRTAQMRRIKGGKLPMGHVDAVIEKANYKFVKVSNLQITIDSDGAVATGHLFSGGKYIDLSCDFTFTDTDDMKKTKIKPKLSIHSGKSKEERDKKKEEKAKAKADKAVAKAQRKEEKAQRKAEKAQRKAEKAAAKAAAKSE